MTRRGGDGRREPAAPRESASREAWTPLGVGWWSWRPLRACSATARLLWLALYTSAPARRCPPGLWHGGVASMAEAAELRDDEAVAALAELEAAELVEFDRETRVARLTVLPDQLDRPANGHGVRAWWSRFRSLPACEVRDRHVATLALLLDRPTQHHLEAWNEGFGPLERAIGNGSVNRSGTVPDDNGSPNGSRNRSRDGSQVRDGGRKLNGSPNGSPNRWGMGMGSSSSVPDQRSGSPAHSSREIPSVQDPVVGPAADDAMRAWERRRGQAAEQRDDVAPLAGEAIRRYGPLSAVPEGPSVAGGRFR